jgi:hypothetical protein
VNFFRVEITSVVTSGDVNQLPYKTTNISKGGKNVDANEKHQHIFREGPLEYQKDFFLKCLTCAREKVKTQANKCNILSKTMYLNSSISSE